MSKDKLNRIFGGLAFLILISSSVLTLAQSSIASIINLWQAGINHGKYYPVLTILLIALPFLLIMLLLKIILLRKIEQKSDRN